jgi:acetolactate synthase-1/2/3 large subunit
MPVIRAFFYQIESRLAVKLSGADIIMRSLHDQGVEHIFGYPGGAALHIYDALYNQEDVKHILVRHEQGAVHAADGYARSTGKPGVALVTSGPGVTNTITGIATAYMDSIPLVVISGQVASTLIGDDAFQEVDAVGISRPCVKHNFLVKDVKDLAMTIKKAFYIATTGRQGPVLVDVPKDVTASKTEYAYPKTISMRSYNPVTKGHGGQVKKAVELLLNARQPMLYAGGGVILDNAAETLAEFVRLLGYPCTNTLMGLGGYPATDPLYVGMLGMHGTYEANMGMHECDVLLSIGARFDDRITGDIDKFCPDARIIHIDIDPAQIGKNVAVEVPIVGSVGAVLKEMIEQIKAAKTKPDQDAIKKWWARIDEWRSLDCLKYETDGKLIKPQYVVQKLYELTHGDAEGSIQMCIQELSTCKQYDLPIKIINLNNRYLGMVRQWQEFFYEGRYSHSYMDALPDFKALAEAYGHVGMLIDKPGDVEGALKEALAMKDRLVFMDFITDQNENVFPMIAAGKGHHEMELGPCAAVVPTDRELA